MSKPKPISQREWNLGRLRRWIIKQGISDKLMPHSWSIFDCQDIDNPVNMHRFILGDIQSNYLERIAVLILANGGYARVQYNLLPYVITADTFRTLSTGMSYLLIDMKGEVFP